MYDFSSGVKGSTQWSTRGPNYGRLSAKSSYCILVTAKVMVPVHISTLGEFFVTVVLCGNVLLTGYNRTHSFLRFHILVSMQANCLNVKL